MKIARRIREAQKTSPTLLGELCEGEGVSMTFIQPFLDGICQEEEELASTIAKETESTRDKANIEYLLKKINNLEFDLGMKNREIQGLYTRQENIEAKVMAVFHRHGIAIPTEPTKPQTYN
jgi:hypothetical protein